MSDKIIEDECEQRGLVTDKHTSRLVRGLFIIGLWVIVFVIIRLAATEIARGELSCCMYQAASDKRVATTQAYVNVIAIAAALIGIGLSIRNEVRRRRLAVKNDPQREA